MTRTSFSKPQSILSSVVVIASLASGTAWANSDKALETQRKLYDQAQTLLDAKEVDAYQRMRYKIADYPLTPYVDYRTFLIDLGDKSPSEVTSFIAEHKEFPFSARVSAPYLAALARQQQWQTFLTFQPQLPSGETYQCYYYYAKYKTGKKQEAFDGAKQMWLNGHSVSDACDPLFSVWDKAGYKTDELVMQRMLLAFDNRNSALLSYLQKQLKSNDAKQTAKAMQDLLAKPQSVQSYAASHSASEHNRRLVKRSLEQWARRDPEAVQRAYESVMTTQKFSAEQRQEMADFIALRLMNTDSSTAAAWRDKMVRSSQNGDLIERRIRLSIQEADWKAVQSWITVLPESLKQDMRWQYWQGRTDIALGKKEQGTATLEKLLGKRDFYSAAASKQLGKPFEYPVTNVTLDRQAVAPYQAALARIQELIDRDKIAAAKSEWRWLLYRSTQAEKEMLTAYAASQHWHHLTVTGSISAKMWNNMKLRFPLAHQWWFNFYGKKHNIDPITLMSVARQESALDSEARSPVGARGIMQIMPATAKHTAKKYQLSYAGADELYNVSKNIEIGSTYLNGLLEQYDNNRIFAFAAYNAGPGRVKQWRQRSAGELDAFAFIEIIPFRETRGYVQNILMFETYYRDLTGGAGDFLKPDELRTKY
ncbi:murein transglycosylase [Vibrio proteolyticus]